MAETATMRLKLRDSGGVEREVELESDVIRLGRARDCEVALDSSYISRYHARLERSGRVWQVIDEGSKNGVILNGRRVSGGHALFSGDVLRLGDYTITVQLGRVEDEPDYDRTVAFPFRAPAAEPTPAGAEPEAPPELAPADAEPLVVVAEPVDAGPPLITVDGGRRVVLVGGQPVGTELHPDEFAAAACVLASDGPAPALAVGDAIWGVGGWDGDMLARTLHRLGARLATGDGPRLSVEADEGAGYRLIFA